ncbi:MAG TPA: vanadium-dependent haloperoxidase [Roseiflexaceae bacterium]|nr:vanadium-dependent haloperoxidase [Roseiflexaceae bacterium]
MRFSTQQRALLAALCCAAHLLAACAAPGGPTAPRRLPLVDPARVAAALPSSIPPVAAPALAPAAQSRWSAPVAGWVDVTLAAIRLSGQSPTRAARSLALVSLGMDAALGAASHLRDAGRPVSDDAALAGAAGALLRATQPLLLTNPAIDREVETAAWAGFWQGHATPEEVATGLALGRAIAGALLAAVADDGARNAPLTEQAAPAPAPGLWSPTAREQLPGADPRWGQVRPLVLPSGAAARVPPPPAWDSPAFQDVRASFRAAQARLTPAEIALARRWEYRQGTVTPPGAWFATARRLVLRYRLDARAAARVFAVLGTALNDTTIACWESKYHYRLARPIQWMQETDPAWLPPLVDTPNHPSYPSGHSAMSAAAAAVLSAFFPADAADLERQALDASRSRVLGGIHWSIDADAGLAQGRQVARSVLAAFGTAPATPRMHVRIGHRP